MGKNSFLILTSPENPCHYPYPQPETANKHSFSRKDFTVELMSMALRYALEHLEFIPEAGE